MDYGAVLRKTWDISWKNKGLWILGILAGCSAAGRGNYGSPTSGFQGYQFQGEEFPFAGPDVDPEVVVPIILAVLCVVLLIGLVFFVLGIFGQSGLIAGFRQADDGADVSFSEAFSLGTQYFWRLLGIRLVFWLAGIVVAIALLIGILGVGLVTLGVGLLCLIPLLCLLIPVGLAVDGYVILTMVAAVEEDLGVFESFGRSWDTFKQNLGPVVVMILILVIGVGVIGFLLFLPFLAVAFPAIAGVFIGTEAAQVTGIGLTLLCVLVALPILIALSGFLTTFTTGAWTLTYRRLTGVEGAA